MRPPFGSIFSENITLESSRRNINHHTSGDGAFFQNTRILMIGIFALFGLGILLTKLFSLTIIEGERYRSLSSGNRIRETNILAPRGIIYDRNKVPLVRNIPYFTVSDKRYFENKPATVSGSVKEGVTREYIYKNEDSHILGYIGETSVVNNIYQPGDMVGKMGIEKVYDDLLRGTDGKEMIEVDALSNSVRTLGKIEPIPGKNVNLTVDHNLQKIAYDQMNGKKGAIVISDPNSGEILGLYSSPGFDPNQFIRGENLDGILNNSDMPLYNRAISGTYPPGSTFKIVTSLAALEDGVINKDTQFEDTGILSVGQFSFGNWYFLQYGRKEGMVNIVRAIKRSNDIFFYKTGEALGIEKLALFAKKMGLGGKLGIDLTEESDGLMPDTKYVKEILGENWYLGNTYHVAIGQGDILATPLQVNAWTNAVANGGKLCAPHLITSQSLLEGHPFRCRDLAIKKENIELVRDGMKEACADGGTGWPLFGFKMTSEKLKVDNVDFFDTLESTTSAKKAIGIPVACKTGTAEYGDPKGRTHAWFTVFAPVYHPQISVTVLVEGGGEGSSVAAPIAKKILEEWFK